MKKSPVITNIPSRLPVTSTVLYTFLLYYFKVDGLYWGIFITIYTLYWILAIAVKVNEERVNLNDDVKQSPAKSKFQEKLYELAKKQGINIDKN